MNEQPDPLLELLQPSPCQVPVSLRDNLRDQTSRQVRRRLIVRRWVGAGALAASVLAAAATLYFAWPTPRPHTQRPLAAVAPQPPDPPAAAALEDVQPVTLEWQAFDAKTNRAAGYFLAGNKYMEANQDVESALRCYAQALDACSPEELEITPDDNWLLAYLKNARLTEKAHE